MNSSEPEKRNDAVSEKLQMVYDSIRRERPWYIRPTNKMYTTAKEKYMIELIKEGHTISEETINHVVGRCYEMHSLPNAEGEHTCWYGYILLTVDSDYVGVQTLDRDYEGNYRERFRLRKLNKHLICCNGNIYYPADTLSNPFGDWQPDETKVNPEVQEAYELIKQKWPDHWYNDELHKYVLKHLVDMIVNNNPLSTDMKNHIIDGCKSKFHSLDNNYMCCSGFVLRKLTLKWMVDGCTINGFCRLECVLNYVLEPKMYDITGDRRVPISELKFRKYQTHLPLVDGNTVSDTKDIERIYRRICHRDFISPELTKDIRITWPEQYLIDRVKLGEDIPSEVISHALEGCHVRGHLLTENYACCRGYILKRETFSNHDVMCTSHHDIDKNLKCYFGNVYHRCDKVPFTAKYLVLCGSDIPCSGPGKYTKLIRDAAANPRLPPRPASPPQDHLDNQLMHIPGAIVRPNPVAANGRRDDIEIDDVADEAFGVAFNLNRHPNAAPPPQEHDI